MSGRVLIADGDSERGKRIAEACSARGLDCAVTSHGAAALEAALAEPPAALVSQIELPLIDAPKLGEILRANPRTQHVELFFLADRPADASRNDLDGALFRAPVDPDGVADAAAAALASRELEPTLPAEAAPDESGVEGQLSQLPLADLLHLFHISRKTGAVELVRNEGEQRETGRVVIRSGDVVHAAVESVAGEKALFRLLSWRRGSFRFAAEPVVGETTVSTPTRALLREGERQLREQERLAVTLPPMDAHVALRIQRAGLPNVIHPLTQEVLLVLELYSKVREVVDHCSYPDYQVLRTLRTLLDRRMIELRPEAESVGLPRSGLFSAAKAERLREWLDGVSPRTQERRDAKLVVAACDGTSLRDFAALLDGLPGFACDERFAAGELPPDTIGPLGRLTLESDVGIELVQVPVADRFAPIWPIAGRGAIACLALLAGPAPDAIAVTKRVVEAWRRLPRSRVLHVVLLDKAEGAATDVVRENPELMDEGSLFLIPATNREKARVLLREMFARMLS